MSNRFNLCHFRARPENLLQGIAVGVPQLRTSTAMTHTSRDCSTKYGNDISNLLVIPFTEVQKEGNREVKLENP